MKILVKYGKRFEKERIKQTIMKKSWYDEHGYKPIIPDKVQLKDIDEFVEKDFVEEYYGKIKSKVLTKSELIGDFCRKLEKVTGCEFPENLEIILTKWGSGGSYRLPNKVIVNIQGNQANKKLIDVIKHEIIHLTLEKQVLKKRLSHKEKEEFIKDLERKIN